ncbi:hypothetical protein B0O80DRAFT_504678 [Mortierella sp. GBAus27b]|nr:hypothetical protein B0O80DRAFT_504678 [Mortierella sp. GBAus27b]
MMSMEEFMDAHVNHESTRNNMPVAPFFFPKSNPSGPDLVFFIRIDGARLVPVFVQMKLHQGSSNFSEKDWNDALSTVSAPKIEDHAKTFRKYCPNNVYITSSTFRTLKGPSGVQQVVINVSDDNIGDIFSQEHVEFIDRFKNARKRSADDDDSNDEAFSKKQRSKDFAVFLLLSYTNSTGWVFFCLCGYKANDLEDLHSHLGTLTNKDRCCLIDVMLEHNLSIMDMYQGARFVTTKIKSKQLKGKKRAHDDDMDVDHDEAGPPEHKVARLTKTGLAKVQEEEEKEDEADKVDQDHRSDTSSADSFPQPKLRPKSQPLVQYLEYLALSKWTLGSGFRVTGWQPQAVPIGGYYGYSLQALAGNGEPHIPGISSPHSQPHASIRSSELPSIVRFTTSSSSSSSLTLFMASSHSSARFVTPADSERGIKLSSCHQVQKNSERGHVQTIYDKPATIMEAPVDTKGAEACYQDLTFCFMVPGSFKK